MSPYYARLSKWTLELDRDAVLERLIHDVYDDPISFVRELIQNALDAMRCRLYADLPAEGIEPPEYPTQVDEVRRQRYPLEIRLEDHDFPNGLSGELERRQVVIVDDCGIGMDTDIIERFFLQIGRSYYTTEAFRRAFRFIPTSRFGVGFLSVFAVSDHVTVDTYKPASGSDPLRLVLTGPRNYLLSERGTRRLPGTRIEVVLRERLEPGQLTKAVAWWCRRVEFPITIVDLGQSTSIRAEVPSDYTYEMRDVSTENSRFLVRSYPVNRPGIEGELYVFARAHETGESWAAWDWARYTYPQLHPEAQEPPFVGDLVCLHGITLSSGDSAFGYHSAPMSARLDYPRPSHGLTLSRSQRGHRHSPRAMEPALASRWHEILNDHLLTSQLANGDDAWKYKQRLVGLFEFPDFWASIPNTIPFYKFGEQHLCSLKEIVAKANITSVFEEGDRIIRKPRELTLQSSPIHNLPRLLADECVIPMRELNLLSAEHRRAIFESRAITELSFVANKYLILVWSSQPSQRSILTEDDTQPTMLVELPREDLIGCSIHRTTSTNYDCLLLNLRNDLIQWLLRVKGACAASQHGLNKEQYKTLRSLFDAPVRHGGYQLDRLVQYLDRWREMRQIPEELLPPKVAITRKSFSL